VPLEQPTTKSKRPAVKPVNQPAKKPATKPIKRPVNTSATRSVGLVPKPITKSASKSGARRGTVSPTSAQRFAARVRARRRRRRLIVVLVLLVICGIFWAALKSPWATVQRVEVTGTHRVVAAEVQSEAESELGRPILLTRTGDIARRLERQQRLIRSVRVRLQWPSVLRVQVLERVPVAAIPAGSGQALVDIDGVTIGRVRSAPAGLPRLQVALGSGGVASLRGCLQVLQGLPPVLRHQLRGIGADSPDGIWLKLGGSRVEWGSSADSALKAQVLAALLPQHAAVYDVRSPDTPAVRGK
jgi:cell division protein FtsQ